MRLVLFMFLVLVLSASGCANRAKDDASSPPQNKQMQIRVKQTAPAPTDEQQLQEQNDDRQRLEQLAKSIPEVKDAISVIFGNIAIVGIDVDGDMDRSRVGTIKYSVAEALRKDPAGINAIVTADIDIRNRLSEIRKDIERGRPISGFAQELGNIIGRVIPQIPRHTTPNEEPQGHPDDRKHVR